MLFPARLLALASLLTAVAPAAPLRILAIGDSLTEEYAYELTFSAPASNPTNANVRNWPELLRIHRPTEASLGPLETTAFAYGDLRNAGHEWNFGIPGVTTANWYSLLQTEYPWDAPSGEPLGAFYSETRAALVDQLPVAEVVVIVLGANDLKQDYDDIFNGTEPANFFNSLRNRIAAIHLWIKTRRPNLPVVVATVPDVGATPDTAATYNDPVKRAAARAKIAAFNQSLVTWAANQSPVVGVARLDRLTDRVEDEQPFHLNGTVFTLAGAPENPPDRVFCRDNFHASTVAQALIANELLTAISARTGRPLTTFPNREILRNLLGLNPDAPYQTWATAGGLAGDRAAMDGDADGDGFPNLVEFLLSSPPTAPGRPVTGGFSSADPLSWKPDPDALRFATLVAEESTDLANWRPVPAERLRTADDGRVSATPPAGSRAFLRLRAEVRP